MGSILFATVDGSPKPILTAISRIKPDYIYFVASKHTENNPGSVELIVGDEYEDKGKKYPTIPIQAGLNENEFETILVDSDNPFDVYNQVTPIIEKHIKETDKVYIDCTGGTKSMSIGLAFAYGENLETSLSIVTGRRFDLVKVWDGMERVKRFSTNRVYIARQIRNSKMLISKRDYNAAYNILDKLTAEAEIEDEIEDEKFNRLFYLSQGFDYWDKFQYKKAAEYIEQFKEDDIIKPYIAILKQLINVENLVKNWTPNTHIPTHKGFILVYDLLYNAERKAEDNFFDDAVARLYRALEMYEQFALYTNNPRLNTSDLDINALPENIRNMFTKNGGKVEIGLRKSYELLEQLDHPVGKVWSSYKNKILDTLKIRNLSYFAHGFTPITKNDYENMKVAVWEFIYECDRAMNFRSTIKDYKQLPNAF